MDIIFFDNEPRHVRDLQFNLINYNNLINSGSTISSNLVDANIKPVITEHINSYNIRIEYPKLDEFNNNTYAKIVRLPKFSEIKPPTEGLNTENINTLYQWIHNNNRKKIAAFDWDRTLSCTEGMLMGPSPWKFQDHNVEVRDTVRYLMGGIDRQNRIVDMFRHLHENKVDVFVVTNNKSAFNNRSEFSKLIKFIYPEFNENNLFFADSSVTTKSHVLYSFLEDRENEDQMQRYYDENETQIQDFLSDNFGGKRKTKRRKTKKRNYISRKNRNY